MSRPFEPYVKHRPLSSLTEGVSAENVAKIHEALETLTAPQREVFNLIERDGQIYLNHWFVMVSATCR